MCIRDRDCPAHNIEFKDKKAAIIDKECIMCGHCVAICPKNAVIISGYTDPVSYTHLDVYKRQLFAQIKRLIFRL